MLLRTVLPRQAEKKGKLIKVSPRCNTVVRVVVAIVVVDCLVLSFFFVAYHPSFSSFPGCVLVYKSVYGAMLLPWKRQYYFRFAPLSSSVIAGRIDSLIVAPFTPVGVDTRSRSGTRLVTPLIYICSICISLYR